MKTMYDQTSSLTQPTGNLINLEAFRRKQPPVSLSPEEPEFYEAPAETGFRPVVLTLSPPRRRRARRLRRAWTLDACASLAVVLMTLVFALRVML